MVTTIVVVDPSDEGRDLVVRLLSGAGHHVSPCRTPEELEDRLEDGDVDLTVLGGIELGDEGRRMLRSIRARAVPVVVVSEDVDVESRIRALELGVDDYVTKPFHPRELALRVAAVLRRGHSRPRSNAVSFGRGRLTVDNARREVRACGRRVSLTPSEWDLLAALTITPGRTFSRRELELWSRDRHRGQCERTVDTHISNLRHKLGGGSDGFRVIETVAGVGYRLALERDDPV